MSLGEAVRAGVIANETLAYFLGRTQLFLVKIGINPGDSLPLHLNDRGRLLTAGLCSQASLPSAQGHRDGALRQRLLGC